jgi:hypothetical protein
VYNSKVIIEDSLAKDEKKKITVNLANYWDDSMVTKKVQQFFFFYRLSNPPVYDSVNFQRTKAYMNGYLRSQGYYYGSFRDSTYFTKKDNQQRANLVMYVKTGKQTIIDSVSYSMQDSMLQKITLAKTTNKTSFITPKKTPFSTQSITGELDRLVALYRQNGYFLLTKDNMLAEVDTTDAKLLELTLDPFEQAEAIAEVAQRKKQNPTCSVDFMQRSSNDSTINDSVFFKQYRVGRIYYYPETGDYDIPDSLMVDTSHFKSYGQRNITMRYKRGIFRFRTLREHTFMRSGNLYNEDNFYKTINNFTQMSAWKQVDYRTYIHGDSVDFHFFLTPATRQNLAFSIEASRNTGDFLSSANLFGLAFDVTYTNRNILRSAIQSSTSLRNGVEVTFDKNNPFLQTFLSSITQTFSIPKLILPPKVIKKLYRWDGLRTLLTINGTYSERNDYFRIRSATGAWGYEGKYRNWVFQFKPLNMELYSLDTLPLLTEAFKVNPYLRTAFNTGNVLSGQYAANISYPSKNNPRIVNNFRGTIESAGGLLGLVPDLKDNIYRFIKVDGEFRKLIPFRRKNSIALRAYGGVGYSYSNTNKFGVTLPFYKQFIGGGPNSMRGWILRQIGLGSSLASDTTSSGFKDRYGDMQLEANFEYRYRILTYGSLSLNGALFTDIGNIWNIKKITELPGAEFDISRLNHDVAIAVGTGLRFDFSYFMLRLDFGIKLKDPARLENNGWLNLKDFTWRNNEFQITDQVTGKPVYRNNYALQLGIGLPF